MAGLLDLDPSADNHDMAEKRSHSRYPFYSVGKLWWNDVEPPTSVLILDLSLGGAAIEVEVGLVHDGMLVQLLRDCPSERFPMTLVAAHDWPGGQLIEARFADLTRGQTAMLKTIVGELAKDLSAGYERFLPRPGDAA